MVSVSPADAQQLLNTSSVVFLDVRDADERELVKILPSLWIPLPELAVRFAELDKKKTYICYCHHGGRSARACAFLTSQGFSCQNLAGGIDAWAEDVDSSLARY